MIRIQVKGVAEIIAEMQPIEHAFDFDRDNFGMLLMATTAAEMKIQMDAEQDPDGNPWLPLSPSYESWKLTIAPMAPMGVLYGHMKTPTQLLGDTFVGSLTCSMEYGIDPIAREEAIKFTYGGAVTGTNQPPRPFYALTHHAEIACAEHATNRFNAAW